MQITKELLLQQKAELQEQIAGLQVEITAKDGALQMVEGLLVVLTKKKEAVSELRNKVSSS